MDERSTESRTDPSHTRSTSTWMHTLAAVTCYVGIVVALIHPAWTEKRRVKRCDEIFVMLRGEIANELEGCITACGDPGSNSTVIDCSLRNHDEPNPRSPDQRAFTTGDRVTNSESSCQVGLTPFSTNGVRFHQFPHPGSATSRTFTVVID